MMFKVLLVTLSVVAAQSLDLHHAHTGHIAPAVSYSTVSSPIGHLLHHGAPGPYPGLVPPYGYASPLYNPLYHGPAPVAYQGPVGVVPHVRSDIHGENLPAQYDFGYSVSDPVTGDVKEQQEIRQGDNVQGRYSLIESDGTRRVVEYSADADGFHAVVHKEGVSGPVPLTSPVAPVPISPVAAPVAPVAQVVPALRNFPPVVGVPAGYPYGTVPHPHVVPYSAIPHVHNIAPAQTVAYNHLHS